MERRSTPGRPLVAVGDFHMSLTTAAAPGGYPDPFSADEAFAHLLEYLVAQQTNGSRPRLLVVGDFLDFLHASLVDDAIRGLRPVRSKAAALANLDRIAAAHPTVFAGLGRFARSGGEIVVVAGNHDAELADRAVQDRLRALVAEAGGDVNAGARMTFYPWIYYEPGLVYAEHGSQYHDINALASLVPRPGGPWSSELPVGAYLALYLELLAARAREAGVPPPGADGIVRLLAQRPGFALRTLPLHAQLAAIIASRLVRPAPGSPRAGDRELSDYAAEIGLPARAVGAIEEQAATSRVSPYRRALASLRRTGDGRSRTSYPERAARTIDAILRGERKNVPFYVFGHTHVPADVGLDGESGARFLGVGTWSSLLPRSERSQRGRFTFVELSHENGRPRARLLRWNDSAGRPEPA